MLVTSAPTSCLIGCRPEVCAFGADMRVILSRGGDQGSRRFEASPDPQEVPDQFGRAMIARGFATEVKAPRKKAEEAE